MPATRIAVSRSGMSLFRLMPLLVALVGAIATLTLWELSRRHHEALVNEEFASVLDRVLLAIDNQLRGNEQVLRGVAGLFAASDEVDRREFQTYVASLSLEERFPGILGVGFAKRIPAGELAEHVGRMRREGFPAYGIRPPGTREMYTSIVYLEPFDWRNQRAFGYDMYAEPVRREAMERAAASGRAALSGKVKLVQETDQDVQPGFLLYVPIYRHGAALESVAERRAALLGWAYSPLRMRDLMKAMLGREFAEMANRIDVEIYDGARVVPEEMVFESTAAHGHDGLSYQSSRQIELAGRVWTVRIHALEGYQSREQIIKDRLILGFGLALSALLAVVAWLLSRSHAQVSAALAKADAALGELARNQQQLRAIYDASGVAIFLVDMNGIITHANQQMVEMFRCPMERLVGSEYVSHVHPDERDIGRAKMLALMAQQIPLVSLDRRYWREDGSEFWGHLNGRFMLDGDGKSVGLVGVIADITERKESEEQRLLASTVFEASNEGIMVTDAQNTILSVNRAFTRITGYPPGEVVGRNPRLLSSQRHSAEFYAKMWQELRTHGRWKGELWNRRKDGSVFPEWLSISQVARADGTISNYVAIFSDISERKEAEERIRHLAHHDYLTGLPNRALFVEQVAQALALARRYQRNVALLFIDLDRFKPINDEYGHAVGDALLCEVANRLRAAVRQSDTVCRQGGDEFVILVPEFPDRDSLAELAAKLLAVVAAPYSIDGHELTVSMSIGVALYPEHGANVDELMRSADSAMYRAKGDGQSLIRFAPGRG